MHYRWILFIIFLMLGFTVKLNPPRVEPFTPTEAVETVQEPIVEEAVEVPVEPEKPVAAPEKPPEPVKTEAQLRKELIAANPHKCDQNTHHIIYPKGECKPKPVAQVSSPSPVASTLSLGQKESQAISFYLSSGFTKVATANLVGTIKAESGFDHTNRTGDGGKAWGLYQWHAVRRPDMPDDYAGQLAFSISEMKRDSPNTYAVLTSSSDVYAVRSAIKSWIRWGHLGNRWVYADQYFASM